MSKNNQPQVALITGITGQDGSYLAEFLLSKGYKVYGLTRRTSTMNFGRIEHIMDKIKLVQADLLDQHSLTNAIFEVKPDEVYNLAAQSFVPTSWTQPVLTGEFTALGVTRVLEAIRLVKQDTKFYQASSSEMFGKAVEVPQSEKTPFYPRSPYGIAKSYGHWITVNYRESYNLFAVSGILFNHESPRRGLEFVTRKVTNSVARIFLGKQKKIALGNLDAKRDWGYALDYVEAMWLMLQQPNPTDFVIGTGISHTVVDLVKTAFLVVGINNWSDYVSIDKKLYRPAEVDTLLADPTKAKKILGWKPKVSFAKLIEMMVKQDIVFEKNRNK